MRLIGEGTEHELDGRGPDLLGESVEMTETLAGDVDLIGRDNSDLVAQPMTFAAGGLMVRSPDGVGELAVAQDVERLFQ